MRDTREVRRELPSCASVRAFLLSNVHCAERTLQETLELHQTGGACRSCRLEWRLPVYRAPLLSLKADKNIRGEG